MMFALNPLLFGQPSRLLIWHYGGGPQCSRNPQGLTEGKGSFCMQVLKHKLEGPAQDIGLATSPMMVVSYSYHIGRIKGHNNLPPQLALPAGPQMGRHFTPQQLSQLVATPTKSSTNTFQEARVLFPVGCITSTAFSLDWTWPFLQDSIPSQVNPVNHFCSRERFEFEHPKGLFQSNRIEAFTA